MDGLPQRDRFKRPPWKDAAPRNVRIAAGRLALRNRTGRNGQRARRRQEPHVQRHRPDRTGIGRQRQQHRLPLHRREREPHIHSARLRIMEALFTLRREAPAPVRRVEGHYRRHPDPGNTGGNNLGEPRLRWDVVEPDRLGSERSRYFRVLAWEQNVAGRAGVRPRPHRLPARRVLPDRQRIGTIIVARRWQRRGVPDRNTEIDVVRTLRKKAELILPRRRRVPPGRAGRHLRRRACQQCQPIFTNPQVPILPRQQVPIRLQADRRGAEGKPRRQPLRETPVRVVRGDQVPRPIVQCHEQIPRDCVGRGNTAVDVHIQLPLNRRG
ncbi:MAG: hypothetical protein ACK5QX_05005, partial [bacterium]